MMKRTLLVVLIASLFIAGAQAQSYKSAIGLRGGDPSGITFKTFLKGSNALELMAGGGYFFDNLSVTALYEYEKPTGWTPNLDWYFGFGGHVGFWNSNYADQYESNMVIGADGVVGLEYTFDDVPINLAIDIIPSFNIVGAPYWFHFSSGLSIRYVF